MPNTTKRPTHTEETEARTTTREAPSHMPPQLAVGPGGVVRPPIDAHALPVKPTHDLIDQCTQQIARTLPRATLLDEDLRLSARQLVQIFMIGLSLDPDKKLVGNPHNHEKVPAAMTAILKVCQEAPEDIGARRVPVEEIEGDQRRLAAVEAWLRVFDPITSALTAEAMELRQHLHGEAGKVYDRVKSSLPHVKALRDGLTDLVALLTGPAQLAAERRQQNTRVASDAVDSVLKNIDGAPLKFDAPPTTVTLTTTAAPPPPAGTASSKKRP